MGIVAFLALLVRVVPLSKCPLIIDRLIVQSLWLLTRYLLWIPGNPYRLWRIWCKRDLKGKFARGIHPRHWLCELRLLQLLLWRILSLWPWNTRIFRKHKRTLLELLICSVRVWNQFCLILKNELVLVGAHPRLSCWYHLWLIHWQLLVKVSRKVVVHLSKLCGRCPCHRLHLRNHIDLCLRLKIWRLFTILWHLKLLALRFRLAQVWWSIFEQRLDFLPFHSRLAVTT